MFTQNIGRNVFLDQKKKKCFPIFHGGKNNLISLEGCWQLIFKFNFSELGKVEWIFYVPPNIKCLFSWEIFFLLIK